MYVKNNVDYAHLWIGVERTEFQRRSLLLIHKVYSDPGFVRIRWRIRLLEPAFVTIATRWVGLIDLM